MNNESLRLCITKPASPNFWASETTAITSGFGQFEKPLKKA